MLTIDDTCDAQINMLLCVNYGNLECHNFYVASLSALAVLLFSEIKTYCYHLGFYFFTVK